MEKNWQEIAILIILIVFFVVGVFGVFALRRSFTRTPVVSVNLDDTTVTDKSSIPVTGKVENANNVDINGQTVQADANGNFSATVNLNNGDNEIKVVAKNGNKEADVTKKVVKQEGQEVAGTQTAPQTPQNQTGNLNNSGPEDNIGILGLCAIILSLVYYNEKKKAAGNRFTLYTN